MELRVCNKQRDYLLRVCLSVHGALRHVVMCGGEGTHVRFLDYTRLLGIDGLLEQEKPT